MKISICTTTARLGYVEQQALAIVKQQRPGIEIEWVLVDFAYEARQQELRALASQIGLSLIHLPNVRDNQKFYRDITRNRNLALVHATGDYIIFLDDYAIIADNFVKEHLNVLSKNVLSAGNMYRFEPVIDYKELNNLTASEILSNYATSIGRDQRSNRNGVPVFAPYKCAGISYTGNLGIPRQIFDRLNGFDPRMESGLEDCDFGTRAYVAGIGCYFNPKAYTINLYNGHIPYVFTFDHTHDVEPFICNPNNNFKGNAQLTENEYMRVEFFDHYRIACCKKCGAKGMIDPNELTAYKCQVKEIAVPSGLPGGLDTLRTQCR